MYVGTVPIFKSTIKTSGLDWLTKPVINLVVKLDFYHFNVKTYLFNNENSDVTYRYNW